MPDVLLASAEVTQVDGQVGQRVAGGLGEPVRVAAVQPPVEQYSLPVGG